MGPSEARELFKIVRLEIIRTFKGVASFTYLEKYLYNKNQVPEEINKGVIVGNRACYTNKNIFSYKILS